LADKPWLKKCDALEIPGSIHLAEAKEEFEADRKQLPPAPAR